MRKKILAVFLVVIMLMTPVSSVFAASTDINCPNNHIVEAEIPPMPPLEAPVENFTVGIVGPGDYIEPTNNYMELFTPDGQLIGPVPRFYFVTGDPSYAPGGQTVSITSPTGQAINAEVMFLPRETWTSPNNTAHAEYTVSNVSVLPANYFGARAHFNPAVAPGLRDNATFFFDSGTFLFMNVTATTASNNLSGNNTSIVGVGDEETVFIRSPIPGGAQATPDRTVARTQVTRWNYPNQYISNVVFDGQGFDMVTSNGWGSGNNGQYFWIVNHGTANFVARDVTIRNIGSQNTSVAQGGIFAGTAGNQKNTAINILRASESANEINTPGPRHFINLTIENVMTTTGFGVLQMNNTSDNFFYNLDIQNQTPAGVHAMAAGASPIKIEHNVVTAGDLFNWLDDDVSNQSNIIFAGELLFPPNRYTASNDIWIQDYRYQNILVPENFAWALTRTTNGNNNQAAIRVYNHKRSPIANHAALQLNTGYWFVEALPAPPNTTTLALQTQLNNIHTVRNLLVNGTPAQANPALGGPGPWTEVPAPNIKMIANNTGELPNFTVPAFTAPSTIVALHQTATPGTSIYPALAHARNNVGNTSSDHFVPFAGTSGVIVLPANLPGEHRIFNFDFKNPTRNWTLEYGISDGIVNFVELNSGRNLFFRSVPLITKESGSIVNGDFEQFPVNGYVLAGDTVVYRIIVTNPSDVTKVDIRVEDLIDTTIFDISGTYDSIIIDSTGAPAAVVTYAVDPTGLLSVVIDELEADEYIIILFEVVVLPNVLPQIVINTAELFFEDDKVDYDTATVNIVDTPPTPSVYIVKTAVSSTTVAPGGAIVYELVITNTGNVPLTQLVVTDDLLSAGLIWSSTVLPTGATDSSTPGMLEVTLAELASGESVTIVFTAIADPSLQNGASIINTAVVVDNIADVYDEDTETVEVLVPDTPNVSIVKAADRNTAMSGETITYTLIVTNTGNVELNELVVTDTLPTQLTIPNSLAILPPGGTGSFTFEYPHYELEVILDTLAPGEYVTITFTAVVAANLPHNTQIPNTAIVVDEYEEVTDNDNALVTVLGPAVEIIKTSSATVQAGGTVNYSLVITNTGFVPLGTLIVTDNLPGALTFVPSSFSAPAGTYISYDVAGQLFTIELELLAPGDSVTITFSATVAVGTPAGTITNTAIVLDLDTGVTDNDYAMVTVPVNLPPNGGNGGQPPVEIPDPDVPLAVMSPDHHAYIIGYPDGSVRPNANITRAEVATIFFRLICDYYRISIWSQENPFPDVELRHWFNNAISTLTNANYLYGYPDGYFRPNQSMTRAEFAAIIVRIMGERGAMATATNSFIDVAGHWGEAYISVAYMLGWVRGYGEGTFRPDQYITRAETAALVNRALNRLPEYPTDLLEGMVTWPDNMNQNAWYYLYMQEATNSHYHEMKDCGIHETWTELITPREWWRLERPDSDIHIFTGLHIGAEIFD